MIHDAIVESKRQSQRQRKLPAHVVVCLVIGFSFWSKVAMRDVLKNLVDGMSVQWMRLSQYWKVPNSASISEARARLGPQVRVIEYTIETTGQSQPSLTYRLITSLLDAQAFPALVLAQHYHQRSRGRNHH